MWWQFFGYICCATVLARGLAGKNLWRTICFTGVAIIVYSSFFLMSCYTEKVVLAWHATIALAIAAWLLVLVRRVLAR